MPVSGSDYGDRMEGYPEGFSKLFEPSYVDDADADIRGTLQAPPAHLVHRVHAVACPAPGSVTVCESEDGFRFLPGGRVETDEGIELALARELQEEAGCQPQPGVVCRVFFSHIATSRGSRPYRPHAPHPVQWWSYVALPTDLVGEPTCPVDGERITKVVHVPVDEAIGTLASGSDPMHAEIVRLAVHLKLITR